MVLEWGLQRGVIESTRQDGNGLKEFTKMRIMRIGREIDQLGICNDGGSISNEIT